MKETFKARLKLIFLLLGLSFYNVVGQQIIPIDTSRIELREFDQDNIKTFAEQRVYNFDKNPKYEQNIIRKLWYSFLQKIRDRLGEDTLNVSWKIFQILVILAAMLILFNFLMKSNKTRVFKKGDTSPDFDANLLQSQDAEDNIKNLIADAEKDGDYARAVRFQFLNTLRGLDQNDIISWQDYKTNSEYTREIRDQDIKRPFENLSHIFEYVVYGEFEIEEEKYQSYKASFAAFESQIDLEKV